MRPPWPSSVLKLKNVVREPSLFVAGADAGGGLALVR